MPNSVSNEKIISGIYVAMYERAADKAGFDQWVVKANELRAAGKAEIDIATTMSAQFGLHPAFTTIYGSLGDAAFIDAIYMNIGGKPADAAGRTNWLNKLTDPTNPITRAQLVGEFVYTILSITPAELQAMKDAGKITATELTDALARQDRLINKSDVAAVFTHAMGAGSNLSPSTDPLDLASLNKDAAFLASKAIIKGVTEDDATKTAPTDYLNGSPTIDGINQQFGGGTVPGQTFTLTVNADTATANVFEAPSVVTQVGAVLDTLQSVDKLSGTGTNPTLNATLSTNSIATPTLSGIETINVTPEIAARTLNLSKATGVKTLSVDSSQQSLTVLSVANAVNVQVKNGADVGGPEMDTLVQFADSVVSGTTDVAKVALTSNGSAAIASDQFINLRGTSAGGFETLEITATGTNRIAEILSDVGVGLNAGAGATNSVRTIKVDGDGSLRVQNALTSTTTFDASTNKGGVNVTLDNAGNVTVTGGEGNDTFNLAGNLTNTDKVDGGLGRDTIQVSAATGLGIGNQVSNVEILRVDGAATSFTFDNDDITGIDAIVHNVAGGAGMTYQDMAVASASDATKGLTILNAGNLTYNLKGVGGLGTSNQGLYVNVGSSSAASALQTAAGVATGTIDTDGSSLTLDVKAFGGQTSSGTGVITADNITALTIKGGAAGEAFAIAGIAATNLVLSSIDGSTFAGNLTVAGTAGAQSIKGGSGNDVLSTGGRAAFTGAELGDVLSGGTGNDTFTFAVSDSTSDTAGVTDVNGAVAGAFTAAQKALFTQITDLNLGGATAATQADLIDLNAVNVAFAGLTTVVVNAGAATALSGVNFGAAVNAALGNVAGLGAAAGVLPAGTTAVAGLFTWGGDTFLIATRDIGDATAGYTAGEDIIIKVTGVTGTLDVSDFV